MSETLGMRLKKARLARGLRQNQVPGIAQSTLASWESGRRWPKWSDVLRLAEIYRVDPTTFTPFYTPDAGQFAGVRHLEDAARTGDWATVWQDGYRFLQRHRQKVPLAVYSRVEQLLAQAMAEQPWLGLVRRQQTLDEELRVAAAMHNLGLGARTMHQWFVRLAQQYAPDHPSYIKVLNNAAIYAERMGDLTTALQWLAVGVNWSKAHHQWDRVPELEAIAFRLHSYTEDLGNLGLQGQMCGELADDGNTFVHEDLCIGYSWRIWRAKDTTAWKRLKTLAIKTWLDDSPMPPWMALWDAAWAWRQRRVAKPLSDWVAWWLADGETLWRAHWDWYLRDAMLLAAQSQHPGFTEWRHWWSHYLQQHQEDGWLTWV
ncbi:helix-turn-helix transcriptional regulator [Sulfobacillus thermosulfidooxidans]|uniref:helix-turn-helix transcriptional regulator n=1 Tax=Sulfobacillus thermosulfidooxidans TaxID=28034 RepID=UPI001592B8A9|nr:helix-turn-helix transcriptional regulator [Sulfobacillus thermosulfidooxidans]